MNKRMWICIVITILLTIVVAVTVISNCSYAFIKPKEADLQYYLDLAPENNYYSDKACISDAQTAARVGGAIVDNMCDKSIFNVGFISVEYDDANRLWKINKSYLFSQGGFVVIEQDTGEIVRALLNK